METAILPATAVSYQEQSPGKTDGKSSPPGVFSKLLHLFASSVSAPSGSPAKTSSAGRAGKRDSPDNAAGQSFQSLLAAVQGPSGQAQSSPAGQLPAVAAAGTEETGASSAGLEALSGLLGPAGGGSLSQALLEAPGTGKDASAPAGAGEDSTGATAIPSGEGDAAGDKPPAMPVKTTGSIQSAAVPSTMAASPKAGPSPAGESQTLSPAPLTQTQQSTGVNCPLAPITADQAPPLRLAKAASDKSLPDNQQPARPIDGETLTFSAGAAPPRRDSSVTGAELSAAGTTGDHALGGKVISQIVDNARLTLKDSNTSMSIQLKPDFLGDLKLVVEVEHGIVNAHFVAQNQTTANLIAARLPELRQALNDQGVSCQQLNVSCGGGQGSSQGASSQSQQQLSQPQMQFVSGYDGSAANNGPPAPQAYQWTGTGALNCII